MKLYTSYDQQEYQFDICEFYTEVWRSETFLAGFFAKNHFGGSFSDELN